MVSTMIVRAVATLLVCMASSAMGSLEAIADTSSVQPPTLCRYHDCALPVAFVANQIEVRDDCIQLRMTQLQVDRYKRAQPFCVLLSAHLHRHHRSASTQLHECTHTAHVETWTDFAEHTYTYTFVHLYTTHKYIHRLKGMYLYYVYILCTYVCRKECIYIMYICIMYVCMCIYIVYIIYHVCMYVHIYYVCMNVCTRSSSKYMGWKEERLYKII